MRKIYVDMDGVLSDFEGRYTSKFSMTPLQARSGRDRKQFSTHWHQFIDDGEFATLPSFSKSELLVNFLTNLEGKFEIALLTSSGGLDRHNDVMVQKLQWLEDNCIEWPAIVVPGKRFKASFADKNSLLIDDTPANVENFVKAGGFAVLYTDFDKARPLIDLWIQGV